MKNFWKKIGKQQNCVRPLSPENKIETIDGRKCQQLRKKYFSPSKEILSNKANHSASEYLNVSQNSIKPENTKINNTNEEKKQKISVISNFENSQLEYLKQQKQKQFTDFSKDLQNQFDVDKSLGSPSSHVLMDFETFSDFSKCFDQHPNKKLNNLNDQVEGVQRNFLIRKQIQKEFSFQPSSKNSNLIEPQLLTKNYQKQRQFQPSFEENMIVVDMKDQQNQDHSKHGILVRINTRSRQKERLFFEVDQNLCDKSDSFMRHKWSNIEQTHQKNQQGIQNDNNGIKQQKYLLRSQDQQKQVVQLKPILLKSKVSSNSISSKFSQLKSDIMKAKSEQQQQPSQIISQQSIQQVIDIQSIQFTKTLNRIHFSNPINKKNTNLESLRMSQPVINSNIGMFDIASDSNEKCQQQQFEEQQQQRQIDINVDGRVTLMNEKPKRKINLTQNYKYIWSLGSENSGSVKKEANKLAQKQIITSQQEVVQNYASQQNPKPTQQPSIDKKIINKTFNIEQYQQPNNSKSLMKANQSNFTSEYVSASPKTQQHKRFDSSLQANLYVHLMQQDKSNNSQLSNNNLHEQQTFTYQNFKALLTERNELKSQLNCYKNQLQSRDEKIYSLNLEIEKVKVDCLALRAQMENFQQQQKDQQSFFIKEIDNNKLLINELQQENQSKNQLIEEKLQQNKQLTKKLGQMQARMSLLRERLDQFQQQNNHEKCSTIKISLGIQTDYHNHQQKEQQKSLTCYFNDIQQPIILKQQQPKIFIKGIPTLSDLKNLGSEIHINQDTQNNFQNSGCLNLSLQLNLYKNKRLLLNSKQSLLELQEYIFDLQQKIIAGKQQYEEKTQKAISFAEFKLTKKYSQQIKQIMQELQTMKVKYDKLKLWVKKYQKDKQKAKIQNLHQKNQKEEKSNFDEMIKNVSDFQRLFNLFNQFNHQNQQMKNNQPHVSSFSKEKEKTVKQKQRQPLFDTKQLSQKQNLMRKRQQSFERINRQIMETWERIQKQKKKVMQMQDQKFFQFQEENIGTKKSNYYPNPTQRQQNFNSNKNRQLQSYHKSTSPSFNLNQNYTPREFNKFTSLVEKTTNKFELKPNIDDSQSQNLYPLNQKQKFLRYQSPQTDRRFCSQYGTNDYLNQANFRKCKSPNLRSQHEFSRKRQQQIQSPRNRGLKFLRENKVFQDKRDLSYISSKLSKLQKDINIELRSMND